MHPCSRINLSTFLIGNIVESCQWSLVKLFSIWSVLFSQSLKKRFSIYIVFVYFLSLKGFEKYIVTYTSNKKISSSQFSF